MLIDILIYVCVGKHLHKVVDVRLSDQAEICWDIEDGPCLSTFNGLNDLTFPITRGDKYICE